MRVLLPVGVDANDQTLPARAPFYNALIGNRWRNWGGIWEIVRPKFFGFYSRSRTAAIVAGVALLAGAAAVVRVRAAERPADAGPHGGLLVVANSNDTQHRNGEGYLTLIDSESAKIVGKIPDGGVTAHEVLVSKDGRTAFAPIYGNANVGGAGTDGSTISVIDIEARKQVGVIDFGRGVRPHFAVWGPDGMIYVTSEVEQSVSIVDPKKRAAIGSIPTGKPESHNVAVSHDGRRAYTSNVNSGTISVMDVKARKLITTIQVAQGSSAIGLADKDPRKDWKVQRVAVSPDDQTVFTCDWTRPNWWPSQRPRTR